MFEFLQTIANGLWSRPILLLTLTTLPFAIIGIFRRTFPHRPLVWLLTIPSLLTILCLWKIDILPVILAIDVVLILLAGVDLFLVPRRNSFQVERRCLRVASLNKPHQVALNIAYRGRLKCAIWIRDDVPQEFEANPPEFTLRLNPFSRAELNYELRASRRGKFRLRQVYIQARSRLGLWRRYYSVPVEQTLNVYPDMQQLSKYALLARTDRLSMMGLRKTRKIGTDNEFERLRDYTLDDNFKHIEWRATARRNKLTVKDFQSSQSQRLIFLLDCGRMMTNKAVGLSLLDHSLNAMLMLSYVALQKGDAVGLIAFSDSIHSYVPPKGGMNQMNQLLHASFDRFPQLVESRYDQAFRHLSSHCLKRSLVVLITNVIDEVNANQIHQYLGTIAGRHLPLALMLRDHVLFDAAEMAFPSGQALYASAAAAEILTWRHHVITALEHQGVLSLDVFPEEMTAPLVNQYLEIKARHLL